METYEHTFELSRNIIQTFYRIREIAQSLDQTEQYLFTNNISELFDSEHTSNKMRLLS